QAPEPPQPVDARCILRGQEPCLDQRPGMFSPVARTQAQKMGTDRLQADDRQATEATQPVEALRREEGTPLAGKDASSRYLDARQPLRRAQCKMLADQQIGPALAALTRPGKLHQHMRRALTRQLAQRQELRKLARRAAPRDTERHAALRRVVISREQRRLGE